VTLAIIILVILGGAALWWLSGYDSQVTGEDKPRDLFRRMVRCLASVFLLGIFFVPKIGYAFIPLILIVPTGLGVIWAGCVAELLSGTLRNVIDSDDKRKFDPEAESRNLDRFTTLLKNGQREEAIEWYAALKRSGGANIVVLDTMLAHAGIQPPDSPLAKPLNDAHRARMGGNLTEAEKKLKSLLSENPSNVEAAMMLMRLYAQDMHRSDKATEVLNTLRKQPHVPRDHIEYAVRSISEWSQPQPEAAPMVLPESVDELLAGGYLGSAIEVLERKIAERPGDFDLWLKLAEAHAVHSHNLPRAQKIVQQIEGNPAFSAEQIQTAKTKLAEWREAKAKR
jgi:tetratricopeptide (TPR) repeat protein